MLNITGECLEKICNKGVYHEKLKSDMDQNLKGKGKTKASKAILSEVLIPLPEIDNIPLENNNLKIDKNNLPTVGCFTLLNTYNKMNCADFSSDGSIIASGFKDGTIMIWILDVNMQLDISGKDLIIKNKDELLRDLENFKESKYKKIIVKSAEEVQADLNLEAEKEKQQEEKINEESPAFEEIVQKHRKFKLNGHVDAVFGISISHNKKYILSCSFDESVRLWSVHTRHTLVVYKGHFSPVLCVKFSPYE